MTADRIQQWIDAIEAYTARDVEELPDNVELMLEELRQQAMLGRPATLGTQLDTF